MRRRSSRASDDDEYFRESPSQSSHGESPSWSSPEESPSRSSPAPPSSPSKEDRDPDDPSISAPVRAMVDFILQTFPEYQASSHPSSRSFDYLLLRTWLKRFPRHIKDGKACHTLLHTLNKFERVSDSPTQGKELKADPDILDFLRNKVPDSRYVPLLFKDSAALERSMRSMLETQLSHLVGGGLHSFPS